MQLLFISKLHLFLYLPYIQIQLWNFVKSNLNKISPYTLFVKETMFSTHKTKYLIGYAYK